MTRIECSKCGEMLETTARLIVAPFLCGECKESEDFQTKIAPTREVKTVIGTKEGCSAAPESRDTSVENTTALIADLEEQITLYDEALTKANQLLADCRERMRQDSILLAKSRVDIGDRESRIENLVYKNIELNLANKDLAQIRQQRRYLSYRVADLREDLRKLSNRGLISRIFNLDVPTAIR